MKWVKFFQKYPEVKAFFITSFKMLFLILVQVLVPIGTFTYLLLFLIYYLVTFFNSLWLLPFLFPNVNIFSKHNPSA